MGVRLAVNQVLLAGYVRFVPNLITMIKNIKNNNTKTIKLDYINMFRKHNMCINYSINLRLKNKISQKQLRTKIYNTKG